MAEDIVYFIFKFLLFIVLFFILGAFVNIIINTIKGKNKQKLFKKRSIVGSDIDILSYQLSNIKGYKKIFKTNDYLVFINEYQMDLVLFCNYYGMLSGNENEPTWSFNSDTAKCDIENPIITIERIKNSLIKKTGNNKIRTYILLGSNTLLNISVTKVNVIRRNNVYYVLSKRNEKKKYTKDEVDELYRKINM